MRGSPGLARAPAGLAGLIVASGLAAGAAAQRPEVPRFTEVAEDSGIRFRHNFGAQQFESVLMTTGSGVALFDYDGDGWLDVFMVNGIYIDGREVETPTRHALFRNQGDGTFVEVTDAAGIMEASYGQGCAVGDYDGDGFPDLYITNYGPNFLYRNRGDGTFENVTERSGTGDPRWSGGAAFFDYDGDLDLDLYVSSYLKFGEGIGRAHSSELSKRVGFRSFPGPRDYEAEEDILYRNNGDGTFTDVSQEVGLVSGGKGLTVVASDFDNDGDQDVFVANDATPNSLYQNDGGRFTETGLLAGVAFDPDGVETAAMGAEVIDINHDGLQDLYVTNMLFEFNNLYLNQGGLVFEDVTRDLGLDRDNYRHVGWATRFDDFNNDGYTDAFVANGHVVDYVAGFSESITFAQRNNLFVGDADGRFHDVISRAGREFGIKRPSRGAAFGDYDNDGDVDILHSSSGGRAQLFRNDTPPSDRWVRVRLRGRPPNTDGIGAKVIQHAPDRTRTWEVRWSPAYLSASDPTIHIGLRQGETGADIEVVWPSGETSRETVPAGTRAVITQPAPPEF